MPREIRPSTARTNETGKVAKGDKTSRSSKPDTRQGRDLLARQNPSGGDQSALQRLKERFNRGDQNKVQALGHDNWGPRYAGKTSDIEDMLLKKAGATRDNVYGYSSSHWHRLPDGNAAQERSVSYKYVFKDGKNYGTMEGTARYTHVVDKETLQRDYNRNIDTLPLKE